MAIMICSDDCRTFFWKLFAALGRGAVAPPERLELREVPGGCEGQDLHLGVAGQGRGGDTRDPAVVVLVRQRMVLGGAGFGAVLV